MNVFYPVFCLIKIYIINHEIRAINKVEASEKGLLFRVLC